MKKYIIYIEDEEFQARIFRKIIEGETKSFGYQVKTIDSGNTLLNFLSGKKSDINIKPNDIGVILVDLEMEGISGLKLLDKLKEIKNTIPVAVLTVTEDEEVEKQAKLLGAADYFVKGKSISELKRLRTFILKSMKGNKCLFSSLFCMFSHKKS